MSPRRLAGLLAAAALLACCTSGSAEAPRPPTSPTSAPTSPSPAGSGNRDEGGTGGKDFIGSSASRALARICPARPSGGSAPPAEGSAPPIVDRIERQVEQIRGLDFTHRVPVDAVTHDELVRGLRQTFDASYPVRLFRARSLAWQTIGAIPPGAQIRAQLERFASSQVIGYYDEVSKYLVFLGTDHPSPVELVTLAHELTHALDDQHFGLLALDGLAARCDDEAFSAALALAEGDATYVMVAYAQRNLSLQDQLGAAQEGGSTAGIAPFILRLQTWPYTAGLTFVQTLVSRGGEQAVNRAFRTLPVSTEQILHPSRYPSDVPRTVDVPQLADALGPRWRDLDVQGVGEAWLSILLGLRLDADRASVAVEGWDGGLYRAWTDGKDVAVVLRTAWDDAAAAERFSAAMREWIAVGSRQAEVLPADDTTVTVLFGSSAAALSALRAAA